MKKLVSILLCIVLLATCTAVLADDEIAVTVSKVKGTCGEEVSVDISLENNTGFANIALEIEYDNSVFELIGTSSAGVGATFTKAQNYGENPYNMSWDATENVYFNGVLATLTFKVSETAPEGEYPVKVSCYKGRNGNYTDGYDVNYDENFENLNLSYVNGSITVKRQESDVETPTEEPTEEITEDNSPKVYITDVTGQSGEEVSVDIAIEKNTGFANIAIEIGYDSSVMTLTGASSQNVGATFTKAQNYSENPYNMSWDATENIYYNGKLATLTFKINDGVENGKYPVSISYYKGRNGNYTDGYDVNYDENFESLKLSYGNGIVTVGEEKTEISQVTVADDVIQVELSGEVDGKVIAALYDENDVMIESKICLASEVIDIVFEKTGSYVKIMWLEDISNILPKCEAKSVKVN